MKIYLLISFLFLIGCSSSKFIIEDRRKETNLIIDEIITIEQISIKKGESKDKIVSDLKKTDIFFSRKSLKYGIAPPNNLGIPDTKLLKLESSETSFLKSDYRYIKYQYKHNDVPKIDSFCKNSYNCVNSQTLNDDRKLGNLYDYYQFTTPIFSKDHKTAFVELNYQSGGIYGDGTAYLLKKRKNKWMIVGKWGTWIS